MTDEKVIPIFEYLTKEIDDLPKEEAISICKSVIEALNKELFRLMQEVAELKARATA